MADTLQQLLLKRMKPAPDVALPTQGKDTWLDSLMHRGAVATGLSEQKPGDAGDAIAAAAGLLPLSEILSKIRTARTLDTAARKATQFATPALEAEFAPATIGNYPPLSHEEYVKMLKLTGQPPITVEHQETSVPASIILNGARQLDK